MGSAAAVDRPNKTATPGPIILRPIILPRVVIVATSLPRAGHRAEAPPLAWTSPDAGLKKAAMLD
jgi:hypothetical protein